MRKWQHARRDMILFVAKVPEDVFTSIKAYNRTHTPRLKIGVIYDARSQKEKTYIEDLRPRVDTVIPCDFLSDSRIRKALLPYEERFLAITCRSEANIPLFRRLAPHLPYLRMPTTESLMWSSDKIEMRKRFYAFDKSITPRFALVDNAGKKAIQKIQERVSFPLMVKPANLAQSLLVSMCYHKEELERVLRRVFRQIRTTYRERRSIEEPRVLVEEFLEGAMYSIDSYVTSRGTIYHCPLVHVTTGRTIGFDDFFGYQQITPSGLSKPSISAAEEVATKAIHALGLRSTTAHIELMKTEHGWKVIEVGARVGGFRTALYAMAYGFDHGMNDILIRMQKKPHVTKRERGHAVAMKFFAKKEGVIKKISGIKKAQKLASFQDVHMRKHVGDRSRFAKHGGECVFDIRLFNKNRSALLADIRRLEQMVVIETE